MTTKTKTPTKTKKSKRIVMDGPTIEQVDTLLTLHASLKNTEDRLAGAMEHITSSNAVIHKLRDAVTKQESEICNYRLALLSLSRALFESQCKTDTLRRRMHDRAVVMETPTHE